MNMPNPMLKKPVIYLILVFIDMAFCDVYINGRLISPPTIAIPTIEPTPKRSIYAKPIGMEFIVDRTSSINVALPAIP